MCGRGTSALRMTFPDLPEARKAWKAGSVMQVEWEEESVP